MEDKKYGNKQRGKKPIRSTENKEVRSGESKFNKNPKSSEKERRSYSEFSNKKTDRSAIRSRSYGDSDKNIHSKKDKCNADEWSEKQTIRTPNSSKETDRKSKNANSTGSKLKSYDKKSHSGLREGKSAIHQEKESFSHKSTETNHQITSKPRHHAKKAKNPFDDNKKAIEGKEIFKKKSPYSKKKQLEYNRFNSPDDGMIRLNKFIAHAGVCSRREADQLITDRRISVNGTTVAEVGTKVSIKDDVRLDDVRLTAEAKVYLLMNKPKDFVTTLDDPSGRKTVMDLIADACKERIYPVGRLDRATTGVLLFTNDGNLTKKLTHPGYRRKKIYHVHLDRNISREELMKIAEGFELEDGFIQADEISYVDAKDKSQVGIEIHSGKNRIVRRIFEHLGYEVRKLDRVYFAGLTKKNIPRGKFRFLTQKEINILTRY